MKEILSEFFKGKIPDYMNIILTTVIVFILMALIRRMVNRIIDKTVRPDRFEEEMQQNRVLTLNQVLKNVVKYLIYFVGSMAILSQFINVSSLLAVAGVGGLAVSLGAKSFMEDIVSGFFILFENNYCVGETVTIGSYTGEVEELGLRTTRIRGFEGDLYILHNGNIGTVVNHSRGNQNIFLDIKISYDSNLEEVNQALEAVCQRAVKEKDWFVQEPEILGVQHLGIGKSVIRMKAVTRIKDRWDAERYLNREIYRELKKRDIQLPYNKIIS